MCFSVVHCGSEKILFEIPYLYFSDKGCWTESSAASLKYIQNVFSWCLSQACQSDKNLWTTQSLFDLSKTAVTGDTCRENLFHPNLFSADNNPGELDTFSQTWPTNCLNDIICIVLYTILKEKISYLKCIW